MAWSTPLTAVANTALNASQWNASVRDNLQETASNKAGTPAASTGRWFVSESTNVLRERVISQNTVDTPETLVNTTTYTNITTNGPILSTVATGIAALVHISARLSNNTASIQSWASFEVTGATTTAASDNWGIVQETATTGNISRQGASNLISLTAGNNTFRMQYRVESASTATYATRRLITMPL